MAEIKKDGYLQVKEEGIRAWMWSKRYVVLREQTLTFHRNEVFILFIHIIVAMILSCCYSYTHYNNQISSKPVNALL